MAGEKKFGSDWQSRLYQMAYQLRLGVNWDENQEQLQDVLSSLFPDVEVAIYWNRHNESLFLTPRSESLFSSYLRGLKRPSIVQVDHLIPLDAVDGALVCGLFANHQSLGVLLLYPNSPDLKKPQLQELADTLIPQMVLSKYGALMHEEVEKRTSTDKLTGLWNRTYFNERFREECDRLAANRNEPGAVAVMALDDLAAMSRVLGTDEYHRLLSQVGQTIQRVTRQTDWAVHWDTHEILLYLPNTPPESAVEVLTRCAGYLKSIHPLLQFYAGVCSSQETLLARALIQLAGRRVELARKEGHKGVVCYANRTDGIHFQSLLEVPAVAVQ